MPSGGWPPSRIALEGFSLCVVCKMKVGTQLFPTFVNSTLLAFQQECYMQSTKREVHVNHYFHQLKNNRMGIMEMFPL